MVLDGKSSQEYPFNAGVLQASILGPTLFLLYINDLFDDVVCDIAIYANDDTLFKVLSSILSAVTTWIHFWTWIWSLRHCGLGKKCLMDLIAGKTQLVLFDWSNNTGSLDVKMDGSVLEEE